MRRLLGLLLVVLFFAVVIPAPVVTRAADDKPTEAAKESDDKVDDESEEQADADKPKDKPAEEKSDEADKKSDAEKPDSDKKTDAKKSDAKPAKKKRTTHKVQPKKLTVDFTVDAAFVADNMTEVILRPESWMDYEIVEVVPHGAEVHAGEVLVKFDSKRIDESIADLELEQRLGELALLRGIRSAADRKNARHDDDRRGAVQSAHAGRL